MVLDWLQATCISLIVTEAGLFHLKCALLGCWLSFYGQCVLGSVCVTSGLLVVDTMNTLFLGKGCTNVLSVNLRAVTGKTEAEQGLLADLKIIRWHSIRSFKYHFRLAAFSSRRRTAYRIPRGILQALSLAANL